jgi:hypothetical protein
MKQRDIEKLAKRISNITEATFEQFSSRFMQFRRFKETANFIKHADNLMLESMNLQMFECWDELNVTVL